MLSPNLGRRASSYAALDKKNRKTLQQELRIFSSHLSHDIDVGFLSNTTYRRVYKGSLCYVKAVICGRCRTQYDVVNLRSRPSRLDSTAMASKASIESTADLRQPYMSIGYGSSRRTLSYDISSTESFTRAARSCHCKVFLPRNVEDAPSQLRELHNALQHFATIRSQISSTCSTRQSLFKS